MLKILSMNHFDMEANSRMENLVEFKKSYGATLDAVDRMLKKFCPDMTDQDRQDFLYGFFPFIYGIYPYTAVTDKQKESMALAGIPYVYMSAYDLTCRCIKKLLE
jgi:hypothetical protein